jgi:tetratricopeptide (TPR) repeat protein
MTTRVRRFVVVAAGLAVTALVSSSFTQGEPGKGRPEAGRPEVAPRGARPGLGGLDGPEKALAESKFDKGGTLTYRTLEGETYFALQLQPKLDAVPARPRDYMIVVSSSAVMAGVHWRVAGQIAEGIIKKAAPTDRVSLWVVSTPESTACLTKNLLDPKEGAKEVKAAITELQTKIYPAGDTDLKGGLGKILASLDGQKRRQRIILFLGDGQSTHNVINPADRTALCQEMVKQNIVFFSVPLGEQMSPENLHGFATGTGGLVLRTRAQEENLDDVLARFEKAFSAPVLYPTGIKLAGEVTEFYPGKLPPVRGDAPTLVIGRMKKPAPKLAWTVTGTVGGAEITRTQEEAMTAPEPDNFFLISMVRQWRNAGLQPALIRADRALALAYQQNRLQHQDLLLNAEVAVHKNELEAAARLFKDAKELAPHDPQADAGLKIVADLRSGKLTREAILRELDKRKVDRVEKINGKVRLTRGDIVQLAQLGKLNEAKDDDPPNVPKVGRDDLLQAHRDRVLIEEQKMTQTVEESLRQARADLGTDPDAALEVLRNALLRLRDHPDIGDRVRDVLSDRIQTALREVSSQGRAIKLKKEEQQRIVAVIKQNRDNEAQRITLEERTEAQFRVFKNLMALARVEEKTKHDVIYGLWAMEAEARLKGQPIPVVTKAAYDQVLAMYHLRKNAELKRLREERFLSVMLEIEKSHVPFPDEPGIYFPPLATWEAIRKMRKEKYEVSSLPDDYKGRLEAKSVERLLEEQIDMKDFQAPMNLKEALGLFMEKFAAKGKDLPILVDTEAFKEEAPDAPSIYDTNIQFPAYPKKMQLSTALRLALSKVNPPIATYLIRRNYIEITTIDRQTREKVLRVYPVGELVIPIAQNIGGFQGGGRMMGMGGGMMGMMGGGMMGMMGMGGGMMGMMGMGGNMMGMMGMGGNMMGMMGNMMGMMGMGNMMGMGGMAGMMGMAGMGNMMGMGGMAGMMGMAGNMMGMMGMGGNMMGGMMGMGGNMMGGMMGMGGMMMGNMMGGMMGMGGMMMGNMMGMGGGMMMMGMGGMRGGNFQGGAFTGGFNGGLGVMGASQALSLIQTITQVVAPGEWFQITQPQPFNVFLGGGMNNFGNGMIGGQQLGQIGQPPPPPVAEGGPADPREANTISFFPSALALIVRAPSRVHTSYLGGLIGGKQKRIEAAAWLDEQQKRGLDVIRPGGGVAGVQDNNPDPKKGQLAKGKVPAKELDPTKIWQDALAQGGVDPGLIVATADFLFENGKFAHAAEFLKANLRQGIVVRPWVYEALAVALEASHGDPAEIRRARLSAVALDPRDSQGFIGAARAMAEHKQYDRALAFCRQAAQLEPNLAQPYTEALTYAEFGKDSQAMEWALGKILSQDWPVDNQFLQLRAQTKADSLTRVLKKENRPVEADRLQEALRKLRERDLVIHLTWDNGSDPADLDLVVREPSGSVCSLQQRQTPGGGILLGNTLTESTNASYFAAQAFSGDYEITVRRNWGQPLANRARLEIIQHLGTPKESRRLVSLRLDQTQSLKVTLTNGRRTELATVPPPAVQRATTQQETAPVNIYTKLRGLAHPDMSGARAIRGGTSSPGGHLPSMMAAAPARKKQPERLAYQTAINSQSSGGVGVNAQAVMSADQSYIRMSLNPVFQTIGSGRPAVNLPLIPGGTSP